MLLWVRVCNIGLGRNASGAGDASFDFRVVIQRRNETGEVPGVYKYICCHGNCPGQPSNIPPVDNDDWVELLYNVDKAADWEEMHPLDLANASSFAHGIAQELRQLLPPHFAKACSNATRSRN